MIENATNNDVTCLVILPSNPNQLNKPSSRASVITKSLTPVNDKRMYYDRSKPDPYTSSSPYDGSFGNQQQQPSAMAKYVSRSHVDPTDLSSPNYPKRPYSPYSFHAYQEQPYRSSSVTSQSYLPTDPWPRKNMIDYLLALFRKIQSYR